ncbi:MAG: hypothetical protein AAF950_08120 [Pseudomonadota bacterium]
MTTAQSIIMVEAVLCLPFLLLGLSHLVQSGMWKAFFMSLAERGEEGVLMRTFLFELWPAIAIVVFHQDWSLPGIFITLYGHLLMAKVTLSLLMPSLGRASLAQAERTGDWSFFPAGLILIVLGGVCLYRALPVWIG